MDIVRDYKYDQAFFLRFWFKFEVDIAHFVPYTLRGMT